ncbi:Pseudouridine-5'-phosphate glycosidase [Smittium culicis]|uniref:Pseudouridine-5'-phosphate glycosidase n=1 Tax=Smittium culicis TaxID=133412 RepID=A0A1R1YLV6_9FUNG|nr:Pseudouridine-5'-phosphate glycosidase [Smittium culicis]
MSQFLKRKALNLGFKSVSAYSRSSSAAFSSLINISPKVKEALANNEPVIALESTIISHGMPYPSNFETAKAVESIISEGGSVPATIALLDGKINIGLTEEQIERLSIEGKNAIKTSVRDMGIVLSQNKLGATTVSSTVFCANLAGIKIFVTGGIGGVHRDFDKESLECQRRAISRRNVSTRLGLKNGIVFAVPIPTEYEKNGAMIESCIQTALEEANQKGVVGKEMTPFLLAKLVELTKGESLKANIALVKNNARVGSKIALNYSRLTVIGGSTVDIVSLIGNSSDTGANRIDSSSQVKQTSYIGKIHSSVGGVAQNLARAAHLSGADTSFISAVGKDSQAGWISQDFEKIGLDTRYLLELPDSNTAVCNTVHTPDGDLLVCVADTFIIENITSEMILPLLKKTTPNIVAFDANLLTEPMVSILKFCKEHQIPSVFQPTSLPKCVRLIDAVKETLISVDIITPNALELETMAQHAKEIGLLTEGYEPKVDFGDSSVNIPNEIVKNCILLSELFNYQVITMGKLGVLIVAKNFISGDIGFTHVPSLKPGKIVNTNGAGDSFVGAFLSLITNSDVPKSFPLNVSSEILARMADKAQRASILSLSSHSPISDQINPDIFK